MNVFLWSCFIAVVVAQVEQWHTVRVSRVRIPSLSLDLLQIYSPRAFSKEWGIERCILLSCFLSPLSKFINCDINSPATVELYSYGRELQKHRIVGWKILRNKKEGRERPNFYICWLEPILTKMFCEELDPVDDKPMLEWAIKTFFHSKLERMSCWWPIYFTFWHRLLSILVQEEKGNKISKVVQHAINIFSERSQQEWFEKLSSGDSKCLRMRYWEIDIKEERSAPGEIQINDFMNKLYHWATTDAQFTQKV